MIKVRIDIHEMQNHQHNILHSIKMIQLLKDAGLPVIGKIVFNGVERGVMTMHREADLDSDDLVVTWHDEHEWSTAEWRSGVEPPRGPWRKVAWGGGHGYSWDRYELVTASVQEDDL